MDDERLNIAAVSNIIFEPHFAHPMKQQFGANTIIYPIPYGEHTDMDYKTQFAKSDIVIVWLNFEALFPVVWNELLSKTKLEQKTIDDIFTLCERLYSDLAAQTKNKILWFLFEDYYVNFNKVIGNISLFCGLVDKLNARIIYALTGKVNMSFVDLKHLIAEAGISNAYDFKGKYRWNAPYSKALIEAAIKEIRKQYLIEKGITKKCLVLDCDNVLWGGILSEDGIENLKLGGSGFGRAFQIFQRFILSLYYHGVILAICSKNDISDVMTMFREHSEMILKEEHVAHFQVNWENKPDNIKKIADTLKISLDSMVFIDDSPVEVEAVKSMLPEVTAILYERDTVFDRLSCFNLKSNVSITDIEKRNETYRTNQSRETLKSQYDNYSEYIKALEIKIDIHEALPIEYSRISELSQRTNKCTNGKRYTVAEIKERISSENVKLYSLSVADRFSDLGLVGALEVEGDKLSLICLSCRVLGREIESKLLKFISNKHQLHKIDLKLTGKNEDIKALLLKTFPDATFTNCKIH